MKSQEEYQKELLELLNLARLQNVANNQKRFSVIIGINPANLSAMLNGKQDISSRMMKRIKDAVISAGVRIEGNGNATATGPNSTAQVISGDLSALIQEMGAQRRSYEEQLRAKDIQIAEYMQLLKEAINGSKK